MKVELRAADPRDIPAIEGLLTGARLPTEGVVALVSAVPDAFVVAESEGDIVGAGGLEPAGANALLRSIVVAEAARSGGVGQRLVERLLADADARGLQNVYLLTTTAADWFPRFGFRRVERASVPPAVSGTWEFRTGCADTAIAMARLARGTAASADP